MSFKNKACILLSISFLMSLPPILMANDQINETQKKIENLEQDMDDFLETKGIAYSKIPNYKLDGSMEGELTGSLKLKTPHGLAVVGTALALFGSAMTGGISSALTGPILAASSGALLGGIGDLVRGAGGGEINGSIKGSVHAEGWDNLSAPKFYGLIVIDENSHNQIISHKSAFAYSECLKDYSNDLSHIRKTGKYANLAEAKSFIQNLNFHKKLIRELKELRFSVSAEKENVIQDSINSYEDWLKKSISILYLNPNKLAAFDLKTILHTTGDYRDYFSGSVQSLRSTPDKYWEDNLKNEIHRKRRHLPLPVLENGKLAKFHYKNILINDDIVSSKDVENVTFGVLTGRTDLQIGYSVVLGAPVIENECTSSGTDYLLGNSKSLDLFFSQSGAVPEDFFNKGNYYFSSAE